MRHGRSKAARKTLQFFARTQGFKPPYHILLDGTFLVATIKYKFPLRERLDKLLQHTAFTLYTTRSCLDELEKIQQAASQEEQASLIGETIQWANHECQVLQDNSAEEEEEEEFPPQFDKSTKDWLERDYPDLEDQLGPPGWDMLKLALQSQQQQSSSSSTSKRYFVACQDETVLDVLRKSGTVPCIRLARGSVLLLENPSKAGQIQASREEKKKWTAKGSVQTQEQKLVQIARQEQKEKQNGGKQRQNSNPQHQQRKKRKAKEPNPLSCKKSKTNNNASANNKKRRRRKSNKSGNTAAESDE